MKKSIAILVLMVCVAVAPMFNVSASPVNVSASTVVLDDELEFTALDVDKLPQAVVDVVLKDHTGCALENAGVATDSDGVKVYKVTLKNAEGVVTEYLFKEDGSQYSK